MKWLMDLERENDSTVLGAKPNKDFLPILVLLRKIKKGLSVFRLQKGNKTSVIIAELENQRLDLFKSETTKTDDFGGIDGTEKQSFSHLLCFITQESRETQAEQQQK